MDRHGLVRVLFVLETIGLLATSAITAVPETPDIGLPGFSEGYYLHFTAYFVYGILACATFRKSRKNLLVAAVLIGAGVGLAAEAIQYFTPGRNADALDWAIDIVGALAGSLFYTKLGKKPGLLRRKHVAYVLP